MNSPTGNPPPIRHFWWLEIAVPLALSAVLLAGIVFLVYSGQKHRSISSGMEKRLIEYSLKVAGPARSNSKESIVLISLEEDDRSMISIQTTNAFRDTPIANYAKVIREVVRHEPDVIYLSWTPSAHRRSEDYAELIDAIGTFDKKRFILASSNDQRSLLPENLKDTMSLVSNDACLGPTQVVCSFDKRWDHWIMQNIANRFWEIDESEKQRYVKRSLPPLFPGYLLHFQDPRNFESHSFSQATDPDSLFNSAKRAKGKAVFIGNNLLQTSKDSKSYYLDIGRVAMPQFPEDGDMRLAGTPLYQMWAGLAQMFHDNALIAVPTRTTVWIVAAAFAIAILLILATVGTPISLGIFLIASILAPILNGIAIRNFGAYLPVFESIFGGLCAFLFAAFGRISLSAYRRWWDRVQTNQEEETRHLRKNFISLISHNLNTPVAKMQGMLDIISESPGLRSTVENARARLAEIQYCIKGVLIQDAIEGEKLGADQIMLASLTRDLNAQLRSVTTRMGIAVTCAVEDPESEYAQMPFACDRRVLFAVAASIGIAALNATENEAIEVAFGLDESDEGMELTMAFSLSEPDELEDFMLHRHSTELVEELRLSEQISLKVLDLFEEADLGTIAVAHPGLRVGVRVD